jgi:hypothetical protein
MAEDKENPLRPIWRASKTYLRLPLPDVLPDIRQMARWPIRWALDSFQGAYERGLDMNQMISFGLAGLAVVAAIPSLGNAKGTMAQFQEMREQSNADVAAHADLQLQQESAKGMAAIANERYTVLGCQPVVNWGQTDYVSLVENEVVLDPVTQFPIPSGTLVCDANGNTAIMRHNAQGLPVAQSFAFTGDREVVLSRLRQFPQFQENMFVNGQEVSQNDGNTL